MDYHNNTRCNNSYPLQLRTCVMHRFRSRMVAISSETQFSYLTCNCERVSFLEVSKSATP